LSPVAAGPTPNSASALIGVDVGGTHTDVEVALGDALARGKALTTYDDFSRGVLEAIAVAGEGLGLSLGQLLGRTRLLINGTTVVTNAIAELRGSRVGVLVTAGFGDTFRFAGGPRIAAMDDHLQRNVPDLVERRAIAEVEGRIDYAGKVLAPLDERGLREQTKRLVDELGVEALAVCFLSSYVNPEHEDRAEELIGELYPDLFVSLSHRVHGLQGENRRWTTAVLNSFVQENAQRYLRTLDSELKEAGLSGSLAFFQGLGGGISREGAERRPLSLLGSGPAGGAIGANALGRRLGARDLLIADMGGTSFEAGLIRDNEIQIDANVDIGPFQTGVNVVDIISIGAGGGSIAWVSERGVPQIGPRSAGSTPGPACYGKGGTEPTVTDAMVAMGFIDPDNYLGGRLKLRRELGEAALAERFGDRFGWSVQEAAAAVHDLVVASMGLALREVSVQRGFDPRESLFLAYGGTLPLFATQIAASVGVTEIVIPRGSSVFCAQGLLASDFVQRYDRTVSLDLTAGADLEQVNAIARELAESARAEMADEGFAAAGITLRRSGEFRFLGQVYQLGMALPDRDLEAADLPRLFDDFVALYERTYGEGTVWKDVPAQLLTYTVTVTGALPRPPRPTPSPSASGSRDRCERPVFLPSSRRVEAVTVYDGASLGPGARIVGPAIVDESDTTIFVPASTVAERDELMNYRLTVEKGAL
jgi:N-methylhydantoinase A